MPVIDIVCDSNVVVKWFEREGEEEVVPARALVVAHQRREVALHVLDLTMYEVGNALLRGRLRLSADRVNAVLDGVAQICPRITSTSSDLHEAAALAQQHNLTFYDAAHAAVARRRGAELATLDAALLRARLGRRPSELVADLPPS